jgi:hypothetical protein
MTEHANAETVVFKIGEDASQKIREKEYRFLAGANPNKYQSAMGKKTVTEWRDIIKRALKREELVKVVSESELADHAADIFDRFSAIQSAMAAPAVENTHVPVVEPAPVASDPYDVVAALSKQLSAPVVDAEPKQADPNDDIAALVRATLGVTEAPAPAMEPVVVVEQTVNTPATENATVDVAPVVEKNTEAAPVEETTPATEEAQSEAAEEKKRGFFGRLFGRK